MNNLFGLIRLLAALAVFVSHAFPINGLPEPKILWGYSTLGTFGVSVFFSLSGYLVMQSWQRKPVMGKFLLKRFKRIFPGLTVVVLILAFVYGPLLTTLSLKNYFNHPQLLTFLRLILLMGNDRLPNVLHQNPFPDAVNSSLWTLKYEFLMYILLAILSTRLAKIPAIIAITCLIFGLLNVLLFFAPHYFILPNQLSMLNDPVKFLVGFGGVFFTGSVIALYRRLILAKPVYFFLALSTLCLSCYFQLGAICVWCLLPYCIILFGEKAPAFLLKLNPKYDLSYGVYIYAFPLQQLAVYLYGSDRNWSDLLFNSGFALLLTLLFAFFSWTCIESPFLKNRTYQ